MLTVNGRVRLRRVRWHCPTDGSETLTDHLLDEVEATISEGVREMACRLNQDASSFQKAADNLHRAAHLEISKESLRQLVEESDRIGREPVLVERRSCQALGRTLRLGGRSFERGLFERLFGSLDPAGHRLLTRALQVPGLGLRERLEELERFAIERALRAHSGSRKDAAETLGIPVRTLYDKIKRHGLD